MRIWHPKNLKQPCHKNGYLQTASDARKHRDRFKLNPLAKIGSLFIPQPLRLLGGLGHGCCCGCYEICECDLSLTGFVSCCMQVTISGITGSAGCTNFNITHNLYYDHDTGCSWICNQTTPTSDVVATLYEDSGIYKLRVTLTGTGAFGTHVWEKSFGETKPNLCGGSYDLPHLSSSGDCDSTSSTCSVHLSNYPCYSCPRPDSCGGCQPDTVPRFVIVTMSGWTAGSAGSCCLAYNGTHVLSWQSNCLWGTRLGIFGSCWVGNKSEGIIQASITGDEDSRTFTVSCGCYNCFSTELPTGPLHMWGTTDPPGETINCSGFSRTLANYSGGYGLCSAPVTVGLASA